MIPKRSDPIGELERRASEYQKHLLAIERGDARLLLSAYGQAARRMQSALRAALEAVRTMPTGVDAGAWIREEKRVQALLVTARLQMNDFAMYAAEAIKTRQAELVQIAQQYAKELADIQLAGQGASARALVLQGQQQTTALLGGFERPNVPSLLPAFNSIPVQAVSQLVGSLGDGTPLREWAHQFGQDASQKIGKTLIDGIVNGQGAEQIGRNLRSSLDGDAARSLTVARTETLRAYRGAKTEWMIANPQAIAGWQWYARLDMRTCPACWAMHGSFHESSEIMGTHPNCRCFQLPVTKTIDEIVGGSTGSPDQRVFLEDGQSLFGKQSAEFQRSVLGPSRYAAFSAGKAELRDFVAVRHDAAWGTTRTAATARRAEMNAMRRGGAIAPPPKTAEVRRPASGITVEHKVSGHPAQKAFDDAVEIVKSVHNPRANLQWCGSDGVAAGVNGNCTYIRNGAEIRVKNLPMALRTAVHEIGHAVDWQFDEMLSKSTDRSNRATGDFFAWRKAVRQSGVVERIRSTSYLSPKDKRYLTQSSELWARSYEQWIALRSKDANLFMLVDAMTIQGQYWKWDEFAPIADAMDEIFGVKP